MPWRTWIRFGILLISVAGLASGALAPTLIDCSYDAAGYVDRYSSTYLRFGFGAAYVFRAHYVLGLDI